jgi:large subunit ribosomal protein L21
VRADQPAAQRNRKVFYEKWISFMFAVIKTGGKQYKVAENDIVVVEKLDGNKGDVLQLTEVLMVGEGAKAEIGVPTVSGASVAAEVLDQSRSDKIIVFKKKRRKKYRRTHGHRQDQTVLRVTEILTGGKKPSKIKTAAKKDEPKVKAKAKAEPEKAAKKADPKPAAAKKAAPAKKPAAKKPAPKK